MPKRNDITEDEKLQKMIDAAVEQRLKDLEAVKTAERKAKAASNPFQRQTFLIRKEYLEDLRVHAEADRITQKELLDRILSAYFKKLGGGKNGKR